ncbi:MAG: ribonuclease HI family protein [Actinomycetota bacterium]
MSTPVEIIAYTDGGARGNPGPAGIGVHITSTSGRTLEDVSEAIGRTTNNVAEYTAVIRALETAKELGARRVLIRADSQLVVEQMKGTYKIKHPNLKPLAAKVASLVRSFDSVQFEHVRREKNKKADALVNLAIDQFIDSYGNDPLAEPLSEDGKLF